MTELIAELAWSGWPELARMVGVGTVAYIAALLLLRFAGQQALAKMTAYGLLVTIALGSILATALLSSQVKLDKAVGAFALLLGLQRLIALASARSRWVRSFVNNEPILLAHRGVMLPEAMRRANATREEVEAALRAHGRTDLADVEAVVLETDGGFSVLPSYCESKGSALRHVVQAAHKGDAK